MLLLLLDVYFCRYLWGWFGKNNSPHQEKCPVVTMFSICTSYPILDTDGDLESEINNDRNGSFASTTWDRLSWKLKLTTGELMVINMGNVRTPLHRSR